MLSLEKFPGKKAFINENIELLRSNVKNFIADMSRMSEAHNAGDIDWHHSAGRTSRALTAPWPLVSTRWSAATSA